MGRRPRETCLSSQTRTFYEDQHLGCFVDRSFAGRKYPRTPKGSLEWEAQHVLAARSHPRCRRRSHGWNVGVQILWRHDSVLSKPQTKIQHGSIGCVCVVKGSTGTELRGNGFSPKISLTCMQPQSDSAFPNTRNEKRKEDDRLAARTKTTRAPPVMPSSRCHA